MLAVPKRANDAMHLSMLEGIHTFPPLSYTVHSFVQWNPTYNYNTNKTPWLVFRWYFSNDFVPQNWLLADWLFFSVLWPLTWPLLFLSAGFDENLDVQGELILQDTFQVWDPKSLIRKGRDRHLFLFEISLVFSKEIKDSAGRTKYVYKSKLLVFQDVWSFHSAYVMIWNDRGQHNTLFSVSYITSI